MLEVSGDNNGFTITAMMRYEWVDCCFILYGALRNWPTVAGNPFPWLLRKGKVFSPVAKRCQLGRFARAILLRRVGFTIVLMGNIKSNFGTLANAQSNTKLVVYLVVMTSSRIRWVTALIYRHSLEHCRSMIWRLGSPPCPLHVDGHA